MTIRFPARTALVTALALCFGAPAFAGDDAPQLLAQASAGGGGAGNSSGSTSGASTAGGGAAGQGNAAAGSPAGTGSNPSSTGSNTGSGMGGSDSSPSGVREFGDAGRGQAAPGSDARSINTPRGDAATRGNVTNSRMSDRGSMPHATRGSNADWNAPHRGMAWGQGHPDSGLDMNRRDHAGVQPGASDTRTWLYPESDNAQAQ